MFRSIFLGVVMMTKVDDLFFGVMSFLVAVSSADILWWLVEVPLESVQDPHVCHLQVVIINDPSYKHQQLGGGVSTPSTSLGSLANMLMVTGKVLRLILVVDHSSHFWKLIVLGQWKWLGFPSYPRNTHYIPLYKVYMGLIMNGSIPTVPPFSLWRNCCNDGLTVSMMYEVKHPEPLQIIK